MNDVCWYSAIHFKLQWTLVADGKRRIFEKKKEYKVLGEATPNRSARSTRLKKEKGIEQNSYIYKVQLNRIHEK